jgi:hypothetical protein
MKNIVVRGLIVALAGVGLLAAGDEGSEQDKQPDGRGDLTRQAPPRASLTPATGNGINYHGGPVMQGTTHVYYIWYGNWGQDPSAHAILTNLASNIGSSPYFNINTTYGDTTGNVSNSVIYAGSYTDTGSRGNSLTDSDIFPIVTSAFTGNSPLPVDPNGVYFVLTAPGVAETSGFLSVFCGWHNNSTYNGVSIKFSFVGDAAGPNLGSCAIQSTSPNGDAGADGMASVIAHELEESATDPLLNAWYDTNGNENADKCAWTFGSESFLSNGAAYNMTLGGLKYLIQQNWVNAGGGYCALSYTTPGPDFSLSISPGSQTAAPGATTGTYTITMTPSNGFTGAVTYTFSGLPSVATPPAVSSSGTFTISVSSGVATGSYLFTVTGTSGSLSHTASATLVVGTPDFSLSISPSSQTIAPGATTANYTVSATPLYGFSGAIVYSISGLPSGFSPTPVSSSGTFTISTTSSLAAGTYPFTVTGTSGLLTHTASATLVLLSGAATYSLSPYGCVQITNCILYGPSEAYSLWTTTTWSIFTIYQNGNPLNTFNCPKESYSSAPAGGTTVVITASCSGADSYGAHFSMTYTVNANSYLFRGSKRWSVTKGTVVIGR